MGQPADLLSMLSPWRRSTPSCDVPSTGPCIRPVHAVAGYGIGDDGAMSGDIGGGRPGPEESSKRSRSLKRARVGWPPALRELRDLLYEVYLAAGAPSLDEITGEIAGDDQLAGSRSRDTVRRVITDGERPGQQADVVAVATVLARLAAWDVPDLAGRVRGLWVQAGMAKGVGRPVSELREDVRLVLYESLGVHPALDSGGARDRFGILPAYVPRDHGARLKEVVDAAKAGRSGIAVLVGGSSMGKSRALWEAVRVLPDGWRLWHPLSPTVPEAALAALPDIAPETVVWLNETQHYLDPESLGEQVAAGLRELLNDASRALVLVLGTVWPDHWGTLTTRTISDGHAGARALLGGHKIDVPDAFSAADLAALDATDDADPRLAEAAQYAKVGQVTQYLAGVPYLMDRYDAARGATRALIHAAMDARRLGAGLHIPLDWLADAPGYLTDAEYHALDDDWLSKPSHHALQRHPRHPHARPRQRPPQPAPQPLVRSERRPRWPAGPQAAGAAVSTGRLPRPARPPPPRHGDPGGHPEEWPRREIVDNIRYIVDNGAKWRALPADVPRGRRFTGFSGGGTGPGSSPTSVTSSAGGSVPARAAAPTR